MLRTIGGIVAGIVVFVASLILLELLAHQIFRTPPSGPGNDGTLAFVAVAYFLSALAGGLAAVKISGERWMAWLIALLVAAGAAYTLASFPHPLWMQVASIVAPLLGGLAASRFARPLARVAADAEA